MYNIPYVKHEVTDEDVELVTKALKENLLTGGKYVDLLEILLVRYLKNNNIVSCNNGTSALTLAYRSIALHTNKPIVIVPAITFSSTASAAMMAGFQVYLADVDKNGNLDIPNLEAIIHKLKDKIAAVTYVHLTGSVVEPYMIALNELAHKYNFYVIEDACHALGAYYDNDNKNPVGKNIYSDYTCFSLHPTKVITSGEGGFLSIKSHQDYNLIKNLRSHGMYRTKGGNAWEYDIKFLSSNYRLSDINAALAFSQLQRLHDKINKKIDLGKYYNDNLKILVDKEKILINNTVTNNNAFHLYNINIIEYNRDIIAEKLQKIGVNVHAQYKALHLHKLYKEYALYEDLTVSEWYGKSCMSLPMYDSLTKDEVDYICENLIKLL